jgi:hypothetical protein
MDTRSKVNYAVALIQSRAPIGVVTDFANSNLAFLRVGPYDACDTIRYTRQQSDDGMTNKAVGTGDHNSLHKNLLIKNYVCSTHPSLERLILYFVYGRGAATSELEKF